MRKLFLFLVLTVVIIGCEPPKPNKSDILLEEAKKEAFKVVDGHYTKIGENWYICKLKEDRDLDKHFNWHSKIIVDYIRNYKNVDIYIKKDEISSADELNGIEWKGDISFLADLGRVANAENGNMNNIKWNEWYDMKNERFSLVSLKKVKGNWIIGTTGDYDGFILTDFKNFRKPELKEIKAIKEN